MNFRKVGVSIIFLSSMYGGPLLRAQGEISASLTFQSDTAALFYEPVKFTIRLDYLSVDGQPLFAQVGFSYQTPLGIYDSLLYPEPNPYLIVASGGFANMTFELPVMPDLFAAGGGGNPIVIWPVVFPDTSFTPGPVTVKDSVHTVIYVGSLSASPGVSRQELVVLSPNPCFQHLMLWIPAGLEIQSVALYDLSGRPLLCHRSISGPQHTLLLEGLPAALYIVEAQLSDGQSWRGKIFKLE